MSCDTACPIHLSICIRQCITSYICSYIAGVVPSFSNIRFTPTRNACGSEAQLRAARSQARALATAAAPRLVVFFSPPAIPARHTSHLSRPSSSNKHHLPAGVHIQAHMVRHSPHPILSAGIDCARSRALVVSSLRISSIPSAIVRPPGVVVLLPVAHSPRVNHTGCASAYPSHLSRPL